MVGAPILMAGMHQLSAAPDVHPLDPHDVLDPELVRPLDEFFDNNAPPTVSYHFEFVAGGGRRDSERC